MDNADSEAASTLYHMSRMQITQEEASKLRETIREALSRIEKKKTTQEQSQPHVAPPQIPHNPPIINHNLQLPPVESIKGQYISCYGPFEKQITHSDIESNQGRLLIHKSKVIEFINPIVSGDTLPDEGVDVTVYNREGNEYGMKYKKWGKVYVLYGLGWNRFWKKNGLKENDIVRIWTFEEIRTKRLCFVIIPRQA